MVRIYKLDYEILKISTPSGKFHSNCSRPTGKIAKICTDSIICSKPKNIEDLILNLRGAF
ncbi:MAG: hypothetical protein ACFFDX_01845 [Candidatus Odinarchaeota archaeon]